LGLVTGLVHLLAGVRCVGVEYQTSYCEYASQRAEELRLKNITFINADARDVDYADGTVFFLFNPFGGEIFDTVTEKIHRVAQIRNITICSYGPSTPELANLPWLKVRDQNTLDEFRLAIFSSI
jgi:ubiquinone/menaquinone biosynthesis C-methylase UbiE